MSDKTLTGSIALTKLVHAKVTTKKGAECLTIPIKENLLEVDDKGNVYIPLRIIVKEQQDDYGQNGFIAKSIPSKIYKESSEEQKQAWQEKETAKKVTPILGNVKDWSSSSNSNDNSGDISQGQVFNEDDDDLPF